jgi:hypothetical protein
MYLVANIVQVTAPCTSFGPALPAWVGVTTSCWELALHCFARCEATPLRRTVLLALLLALLWRLLLLLLSLRACLWCCLLFGRS